MNHRHIIQRLLNTYPKPNYLEVGVSGGGNFTAIKAPYKVGVDPIPPSKIVLQALNDRCRYQAMTSEAYFEAADDSLKFEVVFIDGLHEYEQAYKDIVNALNLLAPGGVIVVHDCKPTDEVMALPVQHPHCAWTGDVWKAIVRLRSFHDDLLVFTLDCDWGCAIVARAEPESLLKFSLNEIQAMNFNDLSADYAGLLNLKPPKYLYTFLAGMTRDVSICSKIKASVSWTMDRFVRAIGRALRMLRALA